MVDGKRRSSRNEGKNLDLTEVKPKPKGRERKKQEAAMNTKETKRAQFQCDSCENWYTLESMSFYDDRKYGDKPEMIQELYDLIDKEWECFYCKWCCKKLGLKFLDQDGTKQEKDAKTNKKAKIEEVPKEVPK